MHVIIARTFTKFLKSATRQSGHVYRAVHFNQYSSNIKAQCESPSYREPYVSYNLFPLCFWPFILKVKTWLEIWLHVASRIRVLPDSRLLSAWRGSAGLWIPLGNAVKNWTTLKRLSETAPARKWSRKLLLLSQQKWTAEEIWNCRVKTDMDLV